MENSYLYEPLQFLGKSDVNVLLLILNQPLLPDIVLERLWDNAVLKICCDGGANRLYDSSSHQQNSQKFIPDFICGDFDSIRGDVKEHFVNKCTKFVSLPDQDNTDFTKSLQFGVKHCEEKKTQYDVIVAFSAIGGRLDQTMANINTLFTSESIQEKPCYLFSHDDVACLLRPGRNKIMTHTSYEGDWCGLIPIGCAAENVTTSGLKYNVENRNFSFGDCVSTSNSVVDDCVTVHTSHHLLWTLGYDADKL